MRRVLADHARARNAVKRMAAREAASVELLNIPAPEPDETLLALDEALRELTVFCPRQSRVVELRYFASLTEEEAACVLGVTRRTVNRD